LQELKDARAIPPLEEFVKTTPSDDLRNCARASLKEIRKANK
jgi:hypothetical protein